MKASQIIENLFEADRTISDLEQALIEMDNAQVEKAILEQSTEAIHLDDPEEVTLRLTRLISLCMVAPTEQTVALLLDILNDPDPHLRLVSGEALLEIGYERYALLASACEGLTKNEQKTLALREIPFLLAEIGEPSAGNLIRPLLSMKDPEIVASAIEALVILDDPHLIDDLTPLIDDTRTVELEEMGEEVPVPLGVLATEAIDMLKEFQEA